MRPTQTHNAARLIAAAVLLLGPAWPATLIAQEAIATAPHATDGGAPAATPLSDTLRLDDSLDDGPGFLRPRGPCGGPARKPDGKTDKTPHGEVWAGVGTNGYREIGGVVCAPLGDNAAVTLGIDTGRVNGWRYRR